ncbi:hypothetical protein PFAG_02857 [Plasmodium falciparum Santa Lucia]|uniref:Uncharacterized protein n=10 Tax=Plasmodium falciparum TaxID=5833 RepID=A0A024VQW7_PLAFA|nr:hypothetical protein PFFVO_02870 [Plasmodium falciparum Vietnam Oak-Knoll (FVO)]ETW30693.1 hypothetical protein PFFCH_01881 [Plasmodium falciparum FCH/4]ETW42749.1 hypothetical protein PFNF135_03021 [Plasmodium falciparum NF135/5.C10]ETW49169.1 hypothetical protein PFMALIP_02871 [Plasmodium falciparum MaliPS096_E11]EUR54885.1 hypothetical protein PFBG_06053 [Plasmodium falciparum 7G8]EUT85824.1 hypothetical protein PFAG_02857 [Plasmodium falciparum Santa Lucia]EWC76376.1 hypothetical prote
MVKIGKKLKGFNEGIPKLNTNINDKIIKEKEENDSEERERQREKYKNEKEHELNEMIFEHDDQQNIHEQYRKLYLENIKDSKIYIHDDLQYYLEKNNIPTLLVLLLYRILIEKPENIIKFIIDQIYVFLFTKTETNKKKHALLKPLECTFQQSCEEKEKKTKKEQDENNMINSLDGDMNPSFHESINDALQKNNNLIESINYESFIKQHFFGLDNILEVVDFLKIENTEEIYYNNLIHIIKNFQNPINNQILQRENVSYGQTISLNKALCLSETIYNNYFYN